MDQICPLEAKEQLKLFNSFFFVHENHFFASREGAFSWYSKECMIVHVID